jgi:pimeloyl-ACP methyl ester carboxylesterase
VLGSVTTAAGTFTAELDGPDDGPLVLLLHGFPQSRHAWRAQQPALADAGYRSVAIDQRGYSRHARPDPSDLSSYHVDHLVQDVLDVADACRSPSFHLVGHDWGGAIAWTVADRHADRVRSLAVLSRPHPSAFRDAIEADADDQRHRSRHHRAFDDPNTASLLLADDARRLRRGMVEAGVPGAAIDEYVSVLGTPDALEAALAWYRAAALSRLVSGPISVPTLYLWGSDDSTVGRTAAEATARHVEGRYDFVEITGGGHFLTDDHPDEVTRALLRHLQSTA